ncbi:MAG: cytochrome c maturation protein CcmE, partial [Nitrospirales bacterium]
MGAKNKKVGVIVSIMLVGGALTYLALGNFGENLVYFFTPSEVKAFSSEYYQKKVRVGGMVVEGSMEAYADRL